MNQPGESPNTSGGDTLQWSAGPPARDLTGAALGDFEVERLIGSGGMGEVYLARQVSLNRPVALKVLHPNLLARPAFLTRFEAEATAIAKLNHPNIIHVYTLGSFEGIRFIAMEYVQGTNLREFIRRKGAVDYPLALSIMRQAGLAVGAAGEIGLVHRDIKPENLMLTRKGQVKVADFGLCRDLDAERVTVTQTGVTMGTPMYMSPEQAQGRPLDHRSDLYSLGVTFYHMLAGAPPFKADSPLALALKHVKDTPASLAVHRPDIPPDLERIVLKLMAKSPADRYQSAAEMLRDLSKVREAMHAPSAAQPALDLPAVPEPASPPALAATAAATAVEPRAAGSGLRTLFVTPEGSARRVGLGVKLGLLALGLALGAGAGWLNQPEDLLSGRATARPTAMPGLWIAPGWKDVPPRPSPEDQYHYAQIRAPRETQEAAWLAVPGVFPNSREWASRAYTQLARHLLLRRDAERLRVFAEEVDRWNGAQTHEKELADILRAGVKALAGDLDGVIEDLQGRAAPEKLTDPALLEMSLEVTDLAERVAAGSGGSPNLGLARGKIRRLRQALMSRLFVTEAQTLPANRLRPG